MSGGRLRKASISDQLTNIHGDGVNNNKKENKNDANDVERPKMQQDASILPKETAVVVCENHSANLINNKNGQVRTEIYSPDSQASEKFPGKTLNLYSFHIKK